MMGLGGGIVLVGTVGVGDDGGVELLGKLAAEARDAELGVARDLLREGLVVDGFDGLAKLIGEVLDEGVELGLQLLGAGLLFDAAFDFEAGLLARELALALLQRLALDGRGGKLLVELVEEGADVRGLRGHLRAGGGDDLALQVRAARRC